MNVTKVTSINTDALYPFAVASENQLLHINEPDPGVFIAESPYVIDLAIKAGYKPISFVAAEDMLGSPLLQGDFPVYTGKASLLNEITGFNLVHGMMCMMERKPGKPVTEILEKSRRIAVLEHIMNPTNVGAIMRSAAALGIDALLLSHDCADPLYRRASRVSMGTVFKVPWAFFDKNEPYENIEFLKKHGFNTVAMALTDNCVSINDERIKKCEKLAIALGSEGEGLTERTIKACDFTVKIPMQNGVDSLNVAAASALAFWEITK